MDGIFDLVGAYKELYAMLTEDPDDQCVNDTIEAIIGEIEAKSVGYVTLLNRLDMETEACRKQKEEWTRKLAVRENAIKRLKHRLAEAMIMYGKDEIKAGDNIIKLQNNGGQLPIVYKGNVPKEYIRTTIVEEEDTEKIRQALKEGKELDFAMFGERGKHISIK